MLHIINIILEDAVLALTSFISPLVCSINVINIVTLLLMQMKLLTKILLRYPVLIILR